MPRASKEVGGGGGGIISWLDGSPECELGNGAAVNLEAKAAAPTLVHQKSPLLVCGVSGVCQPSIHLQGWNRESLSTRSVNI